MTKKEYLGQARHLDMLIRSRRQELVNLQELRNGLKSSSLGEHYNPGRLTDAPFVKSVEKISVLQADLDKKISEDLTIETNKSYAETLKEVQAKYPGAEILPGSIYRAKGQKTRNLTFHIVK